MKLDEAKITFLVNQEYTTIRVECAKSGIEFVEIELTPEQLSSALSRLAYTPCKSVEVRGLDKINKKHECKNYEFKLPECDWVSRKEVAIETVQELLKDSEWMPDLHFNSRGSFFTKDGVEWARATIRRWV